MRRDQGQRIWIYIKRGPGPGEDKIGLPECNFSTPRDPRHSGCHALSGGQVNTRWKSGECQVNVRWTSISIWAWLWWTWNLFMILATHPWISPFVRLQVLNRPLWSLKNQNNLRACIFVGSCRGPLNGSDEVRSSLETSLKSLVTKSSLRPEVAEPISQCSYFVRVEPMSRLDLGRPWRLSL